MATNNAALALRVVMTMRSQRVNFCDDNMLLLLRYYTSKLAVVQSEARAMIADEYEAAAVLKEIDAVRNSMISALFRYDDYESRSDLLHKRLPDETWCVVDALVGIDHAVVLNNVEHSRMSSAVVSRLCHTRDPENESTKILRSDMEMDMMSGTMTNDGITATVSGCRNE